ncbi:MAG: Crp/Fnr family transcriptional regulator [Alkalispirochaeta sp.]|jgi:CRP-like cAMP-binding protein
MKERRRSPVVPPHIEVDACTYDYRKQLIARLPLFEGLDSRAITHITDQFSESGYTDGEVILREGEPAKRFCLNALGVVTLTRTTDEGETIVLDILTSGETFGSVAGFGPPYYSENAVAGSTVCALWIDAERFRSIITEYPPVALKTIEFLSHRLRLSQELVTQLGGYSAEVRVAWVIRRLADKLGRPWEGKTLIGASFRREQIASMAGTTTETCSRIISDFRRRGVVETGREWIAVTDAEALEELIPETF